MDFQDDDLDEAEDDFENALETPHLIHGKGRMIYWRDCKVTLMKTIDGNLEVVKAINRRIGKGRLSAGLTLMFIGPGGKVKEEA